MTVKVLLSDVFRRFRLIRLIDRIRFWYFKIRNHSSNKRFRQQYPKVELPPDYLMYESFQLDYYRYYVNGKLTAEWLLGLVIKHKELDEARILDWGCGPGRIIRHIPESLPESSCFGTDYNQHSIRWCKAHLPTVVFQHNDLMPPLDFHDHYLDFIYAISIFTHLSEEAHQAWLNEMIRLLKPGGILFLTLHGDDFKPILTKRELVNYEAGELVIRGQVKEGHRTFTAFHPPSWVRKWTSKLSVLEFIAGHEGEQDVWILQLKNDESHSG